MSLIGGVGRARGKEAFEAGRDAARDALSTFQGKTPEIGFVFFSSEIDGKKFIEGVRSVFPSGLLIGGTTAGQGTAEGIIDDGGVLLFFSSEGKGRFSLQYEEGIHDLEKQKGMALLKKISQNEEPNHPSHILLFSDGLSGSGTLLLEGALVGAPPKSMISGMCMGDDMHFAQTLVCHNGELLSGGVAALSIHDLSIGVGNDHGWKPVGISMTVTRGEGALLAELDHHSAFTLYEKYFGEMAGELREEPLSRLALTYPFGIKHEDGVTVLVRTPLSIDDAGGILTGAEVPVGSSVRLLLGSKESLIGAATHAAQYAKQQLGGKQVKVAFVVSSMTRRKILGGDSIKEIHAIRDVIGTNTPLICVYGYGEFAPIHEGHSVFQNQSLTVLLIGD